MMLHDIPCAFAVLHNGIPVLPPEDLSNDGVAEFLRGPVEEVRTLHGRRILHCPMHETFGAGVNEFASNLCQQRIFGHVVVMPIDTITATDSPA
jgi:hypothetical protein